MHKVIGIDNGVTGTICCIADGRVEEFRLVPIKKWRVPTTVNKISYLTRIDHEALSAWIKVCRIKADLIMAVMERSLKDPGKFAATISGQRAQEAILIALESHSIPMMTVDSKAWQSIYLPGIKGTALKEVSMSKGVVLAPKFESVIRKHGDADSIFLAKLAYDNPGIFVADCDRPETIKKAKTTKKFGVNFNAN